MEYLTTFINSASRNHLILKKGFIDGLEYMNVGLVVSAFIEDILSDRRLSMRTQDKINELFRNNTKRSESIGQYLALTNIGILFEPQLKIDIEGLFNRWSQNMTLVIDLGIGQFSDNLLYLTADSSREYSVSLEAINHIFLS